MALLLTVVEPKDGLLGAESSMLFGESGGAIGRARDNDWVLPDPLRYISSYHARVHCQQGVYFIEDISSNGVFLNDARKPLGKAASQALRQGDRLRLGMYEVAVSFCDAVAGVAAATGEVRAHAAADLNEHTDPERAIDEQAADAAAGAPARVQVIDRRQTSRQPDGGSADLQAFCRGAGLSSSQLPASAHFNAMYLAGLLVREALVGARELESSQQEMRRALGANTLEDTARTALQRLSVEELLLRFLAHDEAGSIDAIQWLREGFSRARRHDASILPAVRSALAEFLPRLDPKTLNGSGTPLERFRHLTEMPPSGLPVLFQEALARALDSRR